MREGNPHWRYIKGVEGSTFHEAFQQLIPPEDSQEYKDLLLLCSKNLPFKTSNKRNQKIVEAFLEMHEKCKF